MLLIQPWKKRFQVVLCDSCVCGCAPVCGRALYCRSSGRGGGREVAHCGGRMGACMRACDVLAVGRYGGGYHILFILAPSQNNFNEIPKYCPTHHPQRGCFGALGDAGSGGKRGREASQQPWRPD